MWHLNDDGAIPPLPGGISPRRGRGGNVPEAAAAPSSPLSPGCWIVQLDPVLADDVSAVRNPDSPLQGWTVSYRGTLRVEKLKFEDQEDYGTRPDLRVSGDLYVQRQTWSRKGSATAPPLPPVTEIPIFPRQDYAIYFTVKDFDANEVTLCTYRFDHQTLSWGSEAVLTARVEPPEKVNVPAAWRNREYLCWSVRNDRGTVIARLQMGRISGHLRRARIKVASAAGLEPPLSNGLAGDDNRTLAGIFEKLNWELPPPDVVAAAGPPDVWDVRDLHARMLELRDAVDLDREWIYHVLVVPRWIRREEFNFGLLYDMGSLDTNLVPREGVAVAAAARFPDEEVYGSASGQKLGDVREAAFHNLLHELGHAMGLLHRFHGRGFMQGLIYIAEQATSDKPFPTNLDFRYDVEDELRLRHYPDMWIRPGGVPFMQGYSALPVPDADAITDVSAQLELTARPVRRKLPLGAPVRLQLRLTNRSGETLPGPARLSLSDGSVAGRVIAPGGRVNTFSAAAPIDYISRADLEPDQSLFHGETLLRGPQGALFPEPGRYQIVVEAGWVGPGGIARVGTTCEVVVTAPANRRHARVAREVLEAFDLAALLVFRPSPDSENEEIRTAVRVLERALKTPELRDSFAAIEARRLADTDLKKAARLIDEATLITTSEIESLLISASSARRKVRHHPRIRRMVEIFRARVRKAVCKNLEQRALADKAEEFLQCC